MASDPRDYKLDLSEANASAPAGARGARGGGAAPPGRRGPLASCGAYRRVYRAADGASYEGRCPRCGRPVKFLVGEGGTSARLFVAR